MKSAILFAALAFLLVLGCVQADEVLKGNKASKASKSKTAKLAEAPVAEVAAAPAVEAPAAAPAQAATPAEEVKAADAAAAAPAEAAPAQVEAAAPAADAAVAQPAPALEEPAVPTLANLAVVSATDSTVTLSWNLYGHGIDGVVLQVFDDNGNSRTTQVAGNSTTGTVTDLAIATKYYFNAALVVGSMTGAYTDKVIGWTTPTAPGDLKVVLVNGTATCTYSAVPGEGVTYKIRAGVQFFGQQEYQCAEKLVCEISGFEPGFTYVFDAVAMNVGGDSAPSNSVVLRSAINSGAMILVDVMTPTTVFGGVTQTYHFELQQAVKNTGGLVATLKDEASATAPWEFQQGQKSLTLFHTYDERAQGELHETLVLTGDEAHSYTPPAPIPLTALDFSWIFFVGLTDVVVVNEVITPTMSLGVPVPEGGEVVVTIVIGKGDDAFTQSLFFQTGETALPFSFSLPKEGLWPVNVTIDGSYGEYYQAPRMPDIRAVTKSLVVVTGFRTLGAILESSTITVVPAVPIPLGKTLIVEATTDATGKTVSMVFNHRDSVQTAVIEHGYTTGDFTLSFKVKGSAASGYVAPEDIPYVLRERASEIVVGIESYPTTVFAGTRVPVSVDIQVPPSKTCPGKGMWVSVFGTDGESAVVEFPVDTNKTTGATNFWPKGSMLYSFSFGVGGQCAHAYLPMPDINFQVFNGKAIPSLIGFNTEMHAGSVARIMVHLAVQVPYDYQGPNGEAPLTLNVASTSGFSTSVDFQEGDLQQYFDFHAGSVSGDFHVMFTWSGPAADFYSNIPATAHAVVQSIGGTEQVRRWKY